MTIIERMQAAGFALEDLGCDCSAFVRTDGEIKEMVTLADDPSAPTNLTDAVAVGTYEVGGDAVELADIEGYTMADVLAALENPSDEYTLLELRLHNGFHRA